MLLQGTALKTYDGDRHEYVNWFTFNIAHYVNLKVIFMHEYAEK